jgi:nucleoside-diphosphate-sugar epimerase
MLLNEGNHVHTIDRLYFGAESLQGVQYNPAFKLIEADILYNENIPNLFNNTRAVIHLASISNDPSSDLDPNLTIQTNFLATMSLARRAKAEGVKQFIFMSSASVYGASGDKYLDEHSDVGPVTLYALSKLQCERELMTLASKSFSVTILRMATLFGYSDRMRFDLAINAMTKRALQGQNIIVNGEGKQYRPFIHVKDAARALIKVLQAPTTLTNKGIFNVGSEKLNYSIADLADVIHQHFPSIKIDRIPFNNDIRSYRLKFTRFQKKLNFEPIFSVMDGVKGIEQAHRDGKLPDMDDEKYYNVLMMKKTVQKPVMVPSLALSPRWASKEPLLQSK